MAATRAPPPKPNAPSAILPELGTYVRSKAARGEVKSCLVWQLAASAVLICSFLTAQQASEYNALVRALSKATPPSATAVPLEPMPPQLMNWLLHQFANT